MVVSSSAVPWRSSLPIVRGVDRELIAEGRDALAGGQPEAAAGLLEEALRLWRGPALADLPGCMALEASGPGWRGCD